MWLELALGPSFKVNADSLALVSCISRGYNLHWLSDVLGLVYPLQLMGGLVGGDNGGLSLCVKMFGLETMQLMKSGNWLLICTIK